MAITVRDYSTTTQELVKNPKAWGPGFLKFYFFCLILMIIYWWFLGTIQLPNWGISTNWGLSMIIRWHYWGLFNYPTTTYLDYHQWLSSRNDYWWLLMIIYWCFLGIIQLPNGEYQPTGYYQWLSTGDYQWLSHYILGIINDYHPKTVNPVLNQPV